MKLQKYFFAMKESMVSVFMLVCGMRKEKKYLKYRVFHDFRA
jgi:hypothetical protein